MPYPGVYCARFCAAEESVFNAEEEGAEKVRAKPKPAEARAPAKLTEAEQDLMWHVEHGYQLETDSLGDNPVLRNLKDEGVVRPASANRNTVKALEERGLIIQGKSADPLKIVWRMEKKP